MTTITSTPDTSASAEDDSLASYLRQHAAGIRWLRQHHEPNALGDCTYQSYEEAVLDLGQPFEGAARPKGVRKQRNRMCFRNALWAVQDDSDMDYVEGYAVSDFGIPTLHAWTVNRRTGVLLDTTWKNPEKSQYYGIVIPMDTVRRLILHHGVYGIIGNDWLIGTPLLRHGLFVPPEGLPQKRERRR